MSTEDQERVESAPEEPKPATTDSKPTEAPASPAPASRPDSRPERRPERRPGEQGEYRGYDGGGDHRSNDRGSYRGGGGAGGRSRSYFRRKVCKFCTQNFSVNYKNPDGLRRFVTERGKILPRRITGTCAKHQRVLAREVKRARVLALLPFSKK